MQSTKKRDKWSVARCSIIALALTGMVTSCGLTGNQVTGFQSRVDVAAQMVSTGQHGNAMRLLKSISEDYPTSSTASLAVGNIYLQAGAFRLANAAYRDVINDGDTVNGELGLGRVALARNDPANAIKIFESVLADDPGNLNALNGLGVSSDLEGNHEKARLIYRGILELDPVNAQTLNNLGLSHAIGGEAHIGAGILQELIRSNYDDVTVRHNLAIAYSASGQSRAALDLATVDLTKAQADQMFQMVKRYRRSQ